MDAAPPPGGVAPRGTCAINLPRTGPPLVPAELVSRMAVQLLPCVVVSAEAHLLLADLGFGWLGFHCVPANPTSYDEAARHAAGEAREDPEKIILVHDLNGQQAQALGHALEAAGVRAQVVHAALSLPGWCSVPKKLHRSGGPSMRTEAREWCLAWPSR